MKKFDFFKFAEKDPKRLFLQGVYHDNGFKIATDRFVLVAIKDNYDSQLEGKILSKKSTFIDESYPNWRKVIPDVENLTLENDISLEKINTDFENAESLLKIAEKITPPCNHPNFYSLKHFEISLTMIKQILYFWNYFPDSKLYLNQEHKTAMLVHVGNGTQESPDAILVFMPLNINETANYVNFNNFHLYEPEHLKEDSLLKVVNKDTYLRLKTGVLLPKDEILIHACREYIKLFNEAA